MSGLFVVGASDGVGAGDVEIANPEGQDRAAQTLCGVGSTHGIACAVLKLPGRHDWPFAASAFNAALPRLAGHLNTPDVPKIRLPGDRPVEGSSSADGQTRVRAVKAAGG